MQQDTPWISIETRDGETSERPERITFLLQAKGYEMRIEIPASIALELKARGAEATEAFRAVLHDYVLEPLEQWERGGGTISESPRPRD
jgi:hypothetical protein